MLEKSISYMRILRLLLGMRLMDTLVLSPAKNILLKLKMINSYFNRLLCILPTVDGLYRYIQLMSLKPLMMVNQILSNLQSQLKRWKCSSCDFDKRSINK